MAHVWIAGSRMHGIHTPDSDYDRIGVELSVESMVDPLEDAFYTNVDDGMVVHSAHKFSRLIAKGNPTVVELLHHQPEHSEPFVAGLVQAVAPLSITSSYVKGLAGYLRQQRGRGFKSAHGIREGYNPKHIMHCIRLAFHLQGALQTGAYHYLTDYEREYLLHVRSGILTEEEAFAAVENATKGLDKARLDSLPDDTLLRRELSGYFVSYFRARGEEWR